MSVPVVYQGEVVERRPLYSLSLQEQDAFAQRAARSGLFPALKTTEQALMRIALGQARGLDPVTSLSQVYILGGVPRLHASAVAGFIKASSRYDYEVVEHTDERCVIRWSERKADGDWKVTGESKFDLEDARRARLVRPDSGWITWTRRMLFARALTEGAGMFAPDVVIGLGTVEEYESDNGGPGQGVTEAVTAAADQALAALGTPPPEAPPAPPAPDDPSPVPSPPTPPTPSTPEAATPEPDVHGMAPEGLYEAIDRQRRAMTTEQRDAFVAWAKAKGIERPTVQAVMEKYGEKARDLARLMREGDLEPVGPIAAEIAEKLDKRRKELEGAADFAGEFAPGSEVETLDQRIAQMREAYAKLETVERSDLAAMMLATGAIADPESAGPEAVVVCYPEVKPTHEALVALIAKLTEQVSGPEQQTLS